MKIKDRNRKQLGSLRKKEKKDLKENKSITVERIRKQIAREIKWSGKIADIAMSASDVTDRERDFAINYALHRNRKTVRYWATYYQMTERDIERLRTKPNVRALIDEITWNTYKRLAEYELRLRLGASAVYDYILHDLPMTPENLDLKMQAAFEIKKLELGKQVLPPPPRDADYEYNRPIKNVTSVSSQTSVPKQLEDKSMVVDLSHESAEELLKLASDIELLEAQETLNGPK